MRYYHYNMSLTKRFGSHKIILISGFIQLLLSLVFCLSFFPFSDVVSRFSVSLPYLYGACAFFFLLSGFLHIVFYWKSASANDMMNIEYEVTLLLTLGLVALSAPIFMLLLCGLSAIPRIINSTNSIYVGVNVLAGVLLADVFVYGLSMAVFWNKIRQNLFERNINLSNTNIMYWSQTFNIITCAFFLILGAVKYDTLYLLAPNETVFYFVPLFGLILVSVCQLFICGTYKKVVNDSVSNGEASEVSLWTHSYVCPKCGNEIYENEPFCPSCGCHIQNESVAS